ncbi:MAG TPA: alpha/beta hydrolase [bacterium]|jgi:predicted alpha/beta hydrolase family esterase|nr:alpha/beta hydrolase [bacterium]
MNPFPTGITRVYLAGLHGSETEHWQSRWLRQDPSALWLEQENWDHPDLDRWTSDLGRAAASSRGPLFLVAHSLGCHLAAAWAGRAGAGRVLGALLVAPPDPSRPELRALVRGLDRLPQSKLPFPSLLVASRDDPYAGLGQAKQLAAQWGSRLLDAGKLGHINLASNLGDWEQGLDWLASFQAGLLPAARPLPARR